GTEAAIAELWLEVLGATVTTCDADFFDLGGGSLTAAQLVSLLRRTNPDVAVGDIYEIPTLGALAAHVGSLDRGGDHTTDRSVAPIPVKTQVGQVTALVLLRLLAAPRWLVWLLAASTAANQVFDATWLPAVSWWWLLLGALVFLTPVGRMLL